MTPDPPLQCPCGDTAGPFIRTPTTPTGWTCEDCHHKTRQTTTQEPQT